MAMLLHAPTIVRAASLMPVRAAANYWWDDPADFPRFKLPPFLLWDQITVGDYSFDVDAAGGLYALRQSLAYQEALRLVEVDAHFRVDGLQPIAGRVELGPAHVGGAVQHLPLQVAEIDDVEVHQADPADAGGGEVQPQRRAQAAGADEQDAGRLEALLPLDADLGHDEVAAVALDFLR